MKRRTWGVSIACFAFLIAAVAVDAQTGAYVTNRNDDTVSVINTANNTVIKTVPVGDGPEAVAVNSANTMAYVANGAADTVSVIDIESNTVVDTITVGDNPQGVAVHPSTFWVYVVNDRSFTVSVIDADTNTVIDTIPVGINPLRAVVNPGGHRLYVTVPGEDYVSVIDTITNLEITQIDIGSNVGLVGLDATPDRSRLYVANSIADAVSVIDTATNAVVDTITVGSAEAVAVTPDGEHAYVTQRADDGVTVIETATDTVVDSLDLAPLAAPRGLAVTPDGNRVYVTNSAFIPGIVSVINTGTNAVVDTVTVGLGPIAFGKFISPTTLLFADRFESGDVSAWTDAAGFYVGAHAVNGASAYWGDFGLEVTVGETCTAPDDLTITSPPQIQGEFLACNSITASGVEVTGAGAVFAAGTSIAIGDSFSVPTGPPFIADVDPGLVGGLGYVEWKSSGALGGYNASFFLKLDDLSITEGDLVELFNGYSKNGNVQFKLILKYNATLTENRLVLSVRQDNGSYVDTPANEEIVLPDGWNSISVDWETGSGDGSLIVWINGGPEVGLTGIDNDQQQLDLVRLGYVGGTISTTTGSMRLDDFWSQF